MTDFFYHGYCAKRFLTILHSSKTGAVKLKFSLRNRSKQPGNICIKIKNVNEKLGFGKYNVNVFLYWRIVYENEIHYNIYDSGNISRWSL